MAAWAEVYLLLWGILATTVTIHLAAPHGRNSPRIVRPLGSGVNPNLELEQLVLTYTPVWSDLSGDLHVCILRVTVSFS